MNTTLLRPSPDDLPPKLVVDVVVAGAGVVGLTLAIALAQAGFTVASVGPTPNRQTGRTVALLDGSVRLLAAIGAWPAVEADAAPLRTMRIVDETPSVFRAPPVTFEAAAIGLSAFGQNVGNDALVEALLDLAISTPGLQRVEDVVIEAGHTAPRHATVSLGGGGTVSALLRVAADGARSVLRVASGIPVHEHNYPQVALTTLLTHTVPHGDISTEFHTPQGPFTLVPLRDGSDGRHRSSLVWVMAPGQADRRAALPTAAFAETIETQSRGLLGAIAVEGAVGRFPIRRIMADRLVGPRLALAGEAAHALPPIGAQGLNLSLRDVAALVDILAQARRGGRDIGDPVVLDAYERSRRGDIALRGAGVHALNLSLLARSLPVDLLRGVGLRALGALGPVRDALMRQGLSPGDASVPSLMRAPVGDA